MKTINSSPLLHFQASEITLTSDTDNLAPPTYMNKAWNNRELEKVREPQIVGFLHGEEKINFSQFIKDKLIDIKNLKIKSPQSENYELPLELSSYQELIKKIVSYERLLNPEVLNYYAYLSIEQKEVFPAQHTTRPLRLYDYEHQQSDIALSHSYLVYDKAPPLFVRQKFKVGYNWNPAKHNYIKGFERQADSENKIYCDPYSILLVSPYELYEEGVSYTEGVRTQLRVLYSLTPRDNTPNALNHLSALSTPPDITQDDILASELIAKMEKQNKKVKTKTKSKVVVEKIGE